MPPLPFTAQREWRSGLSFRFRFLSQAARPLPTGPAEPWTLSIVVNRERIFNISAIHVHTDPAETVECIGLCTISPRARLHFTALRCTNTK